MDQEALVAELRKLRNELVHKGKRGPLALLMLLAADQDPGSGYWNLIVSSKALDKQSRAEALREIAEIMQRSLGLSRQQISRATVLRTDDPFVKALNNAFQARNKAINLVGTNVSGFEIPRAILFDSYRSAA
jgi:hypothetical protein